MSKNLYLIVCAAAPAAHADALVQSARSQSWDVWVIATPATRDFADFALLQQASGHPVRTSYNKPGSDSARMPNADALVVAPASMNTIGKWANGISDSLATGILAESFGFGIPMVALPFVSDAQARNPAYLRNVTFLQESGAGRVPAR